MNSFDLDKSIAAWRRRYEHDPAFTPEDVRELERHVRDQVQALVEEGLAEEEAFLKAVREIGEHEEVRAAYRNVRPGKRRREHSLIHHLLAEAAMLKNYLTIALRNLRRQKGYAFINVFGLAVGMACCLLIGLYIEDELSYDRFHEDADRLVVMVHESRGMFGGKSISTPYPLATSLQQDIPDVLLAIRTWGGGIRSVSRVGTDLKSDRRVLVADSTFFQAFTFPLIQGDPGAVLTTPDAIVIDESTADFFFGKENPIGKTLQFENWGEESRFTVTGITEDVPRHSTIDFEVIIPMSTVPERYGSGNGWGSSMYQTYARLREGVTAEIFTEKVSSIVRAQFENPEHTPAISAMPLTSYYLSDISRAQNFQGQSRYIYIFGSIAVFVLLIAAINYVNLVTAQSTQRSREVGVRKTLGARRGELARQFLLESLLLCFGALILSLLLMAIALPGFNALFEKELSLSLREHGVVLLGLAVILLGVTLLASGYPAFILSRFDPVQALRGAGSTMTPRSGGWVRKGLVVLQFTVTMALITGTAVIYSQLRFVQNKDLGFDGEQVIVIGLPQDDSQIRDAIKQEVLANPDVISATVAMAIPSRFNIRLGNEARSYSPAAGVDTDVVFAPGVVDHDYVEALGIELLAGRDFSPAYPSDALRAYILNEAAVQAMGWTVAEAVGKSFKLGGEDAPEGEVIGVMENFHTQSLREEMEPVALQIRVDEGWSSGYQLAAKLSPDDIQGGVEHLRRTLARFAPDRPFTYEFLDDRFDAMYRSEEQIGRIFTSFAGLAILIACMGLFGLAAFTAERRSKEIGIRKVLGATVSNIVALLSKDFLKLVAVGFVVAVPLAYFFMSRWLEDFAYRIELGPGIFLLAGAVALVIALATVGYQAVRAALADPVKSLRYE